MLFCLWPNNSEVRPIYTCHSASTLVPTWPRRKLKLSTNFDVAVVVELNRNEREPTRWSMQPLQPLKSHVYDVCRRCRGATILLRRKCRRQCWGIVATIVRAQRRSIVITRGHLRRRRLEQHGPRMHYTTLKLSSSRSACRIIHIMMCITRC